VRFGIPLSALPKEATVVNLPVSFVASHRGLVLTTAGIIALLGCGIAILLFNIFRRKVAEDEQRRIGAQLIHSQKMEAVGHLAGGIAHDFNNILTAIIGYANLLRKRVAGDDRSVSYVDQVLTASARAARLTKGLLAFSRRQVMEPSVVDVNELVAGVERIARRIIGEDIEFTTVMHPEPLHVLADAGQIDQVLLNLCTNARDAMPNGGRLAIVTSRLTVDEEYSRTHFFDRSGSFAVISVSDTGTGMDEKTRRHIFEPFFTTKEVGRGTGLGLAIAYGIIKQHNGTINVYSEPGTGTTFKVFLPLTAEREQPEAAVAAVRPPGGSETILLAEDEEEVRNMLKLVLTDAGYTVIVASDGDDALAKFKQDPGTVQLLLSDVIMPKRNGKELAEAIHAVRPNVRLLFMSGYTADIVQRKGIIDTEAYRFLSKPVIPDQLLKAVRDALDDVKE
jgi:signal transduction histidine kinase/CheY-like chemotaxis protein